MELVGGAGRLGWVCHIVVNLLRMQTLANCTLRFRREKISQGKSFSGDASLAVYGCDPKNLY